MVLHLCICAILTPWGAMNMPPECHVIFQITPKKPAKSMFQVFHLPAAGIILVNATSESLQSWQVS